MTDVILSAVQHLAREDGRFLSPWSRRRARYRPLDANACVGLHRSLAA